MNKLLLLLALLLAPPAFAETTWCKRIDTSSTNITAAFSGYGAISFGGNTVNQINAVDIINLTAIEIAVNCINRSTASAPSDTSAYNFYVAAGYGYSSSPKATLGKYCYPRSMGATISSGIAVVCVTGY